MRAGANTRVTGYGLVKLTKAAVSAAAMARETAWRQGMIAFEGVSLATAAVEFSRYSDTRIVIDDVADAAGVRVWPNPADDRLSIALGDLSGSLDLDLFDIAGRSVIARSVSNNASGMVDLDINAVAPGEYVLRIRHADGASMHRVVVR